MPRQQSTAAKKARAAARHGVKYTTALREEQENDALYSTGARPSGFSAAFDLVNSPALQAARAAADLVNSPALQAAALARFPDLDKLQKSMDRATAFAVRFTPPA